MGKVCNELVQWIRPVIVVIVAIIVSNFIIPGKLVGIPGEFGSAKIDTGYKITCHFKLKNKGFLKIKSEKIQLNIPKAARISEIDIPTQYNYLYKIIGGGKNHNFVVFLVEGMKGRESMEGSITFPQHSKWEKDYVKPLSFSK